MHFPSDIQLAAQMATSDIITQVVDDDKGPSTKREYEIARVPAGDALMGKVVDFLGRAPGSQVQLGTSLMVPLFGEQPDMESREQIAEALLTGVKVRICGCR